MGGWLQIRRSIIIMVKAIKIIYDVENKVNFLFLSEFFRFVGIFVGEERKDEYFNQRKNEEDAQCFDSCVFIGKLLEEEILESNIINLLDLNSNYDEVESTGKESFRGQSKEYKISMLLKWIKAVYGVLQNETLSEKSEMPFELAEKLITIYVENDLDQHSVDLLYFSNKPSFAVESAQQAFRKAHQDLLQMREEFDCKNEYLEYAIIWCKVNINYTCKYQDEMLYFEEPELTGCCKELIKEYPQFVKAKVLLGQCYDAFADKATDTILAYKSALESISEECYSTEILYKIGRKFETFDANKKDAQINYKKAYLKKMNIRNLFKMGVFARGDKNFEDAFKYFDDIISELKLSMQNNYLSPLELEYAYKAYYQKCYIYYMFLVEENLTFEKDISVSQEIINYGKKAAEIWNEKVKSDKFYDDFYGNKEEEYRQLSRSRINLRNVYRMISRAYAEQLNTELSAEYWNKAEHE